MKQTSKNIIFIVIALLYTFFQISSTYASTLDKKIDSPILESPSAVLIDAETGIVLYDKSMNKKTFPASTTKIMTALLTLEYANGDLNQRIKFSENAIYSIERGSSHIAMDVDETLSLNDALYAIMLASANEVSAALAEHIGGSVEGFSEMMNVRAKELGAQNTNFVNPHGLDNEKHYSTAYDLALIMQEAIKHDKFNEIIATLQTSIPPTEKQPENRPLNNTNRLIFNGSFYYENVVGGKTGYTDTARHSLVSYAKKGDINLISVIMEAEKNIPYTDSIALYEYAFPLYDNVMILDKNNFTTSHSIYSDNIDTQVLTLIPKNDISSNIPSTIDISNIKKEPFFDSYTTSNLKNGDIFGVLNLTYNGNLIAQTDLIISEINIEPIKHALLLDDPTDIAVFNQFEPETVSSSIFTIKNFLIMIIMLISALTALSLFRTNRINKQRRRLYARRHRHSTSKNYRYKNSHNDL